MTITVVRVAFRRFPERGFERRRGRRTRLRVRAERARVRDEVHRRPAGTSFQQVVVRLARSRALQAVDAAEAAVVEHDDARACDRSATEVAISEFIIR